MRKVRLFVLLISIVAPILPVSAAGAGAEDSKLTLSEFTVPKDVMCDVTRQWRQEMLAEQPEGGWAPIEFHPTDDQLARMGLPSKDVLLSRRYPKPTLVTRDGTFSEVPLSALEAAVRGQNDPAVAAYSGTGCLGIRPGAWLLLLSGGGIGWCSMAHVYGSPGSYDVSTAGHCGKTGDTATAIAAVGNRSGATGVVLLDFGKFATSHDNGLGDDWALIDVFSQYQSLVTPTMCVWGGPRGMYTKTGDVVELKWRGGRPTAAATPDPLLAQAIVHYGHGIGVGAGGTPRAGTAIAWRQKHFMFTGAITFGDSGSGANTVLGDTVGANMEAAGIITHLYIDPLMRQGIGIMGGTRATQVSGTLANGQIVPYPAPAPGLP